MKVKPSRVFLKAEALNYAPTFDDHQVKALAV